uniref:UPAR/Ly6 domain-containing protein n=1 Tax=Erpetoichthys calabaricus TaxID=27687 RepID=A0A8C4SSB6_ERPCA
QGVLLEIHLSGLGGTHMTQKWLCFARLGLWKYSWVCGSTTINKGCLNGATCTAGSVLGNINIGVASTSMQCCSTDFCNFNGSTTARVNLVLLGISILVIYFVGKTTI